MKRNLARLILIISVIVWLFMVVSVLTGMTAKADSAPQNDGRLPGDDVPATERCYMTDEEIQEDFENYYIQSALLAKANKIEDVKVSHYCCCVKCCGKIDGITYSGVKATPGVTVAVDTSIIPLGSDVLVDYGDGVLHYMRADDTGSAIKGKHIDVCVESHEEAVQAGVKTATVWWCES